MNRIGDRCFLESIIETFAFGDLKRFANSFVVGAKSKESRNKRFVGAVTLARSREGAMKLQHGTLWGPAHKSAAQQSKTAGTRGVR